jgi:hypothetical protein
MRVVFRHNQVNGSMVQSHWCGTNERGTLKTEIYDNVFNGSYGSGLQFTWPVAFRSGTGVIFNNTVTNYQTNNFYVFNYRTCINYVGRFSRCNGTNQYDGNTPGEWGWPCRDQIGRGSGQAVTAPQPSVPLYAWSNGAARVVVSGDFDQCLVSSPHQSDHIKAVPHSNGEVDFVDGAPMPGYTPFVYPHPLTAARD